MDHRQLEIFLVTAERLSLSRAAEALDITQPGLSKSLQRLQNELGTKLYQRRGRGIALTEAGRALADFAAQSWILPGRQELVRKRLERAFKSAKLPEPVVAVETDSLSLTLATLRTTDCLGLMTSQILSQPEAHGLALIDVEPL